jgi:hypothetical protein
MDLSQKKKLSITKETRTFIKTKITTRIKLKKRLKLIFKHEFILKEINVKTLGKNKKKNTYS